jgi:hypothetical protein
MTSQLGLSSNSCCQSQRDRMTLCTALATPRSTESHSTYLPHMPRVTCPTVEQLPCTHMTSECHKRVHAGPTHVHRPHAALDTGCPQYVADTNHGHIPRAWYPAPTAPTVLGTLHMCFSEHCCREEMR